MTFIFVEIFDPPIMPSKGLVGLSTIFSSASISSSINKPKHASFIKFTIPYVDACFRCAVPNASMTKISPNCPNFFESSSSLFFSPSKDLIFSSIVSDLLAFNSSKDFTNLTSFPSNSLNLFATGANENSSAIGSFSEGLPR